MAKPDGRGKETITAGRQNKTGKVRPNEKTRGAAEQTLEVLSNNNAGIYSGVPKATKPSIPRSGCPLPGKRLQRYKHIEAFISHRDKSRRYYWVTPLA